MRLGYDVDEVLCLMHPAWCRVYNMKGLTHRILRPQDITHNPEDFSNGQWPGLFDPDVLGSHLYSEELVSPMSEAGEHLEHMRDLGHTITFVTACGDNNHMAAAKLDWMIRHRLFEPGDLFMPLCRPRGPNHGPSKATAPVDVLLDDSPKHVSRFEGPFGVLMRRPHNTNDPFTGWYEVSDFRDFARLVEHFDQLLQGGQREEKSLAGQGR